MSQGATFSDESPTGQDSDEFRGLGRATVAARMPDLDGFEWLSRLRRDYLPAGAEPKARLVLRIMETNPAARALVDEGIGTATIVIIDLGESYRSLLADVLIHFGQRPPSRGRAIEIVANSELRKEMSLSLMTVARENAINDTVIPGVEWLLREVASSSGLSPPREGTLIDHQALREMGPQTFKEFVARFSAAFGDALAPEKRRSAIINAMEGRQFLAPGYIAFETLGATIAMDRVFDYGDSQAFARLQHAHEAVLDVLDDVNNLSLWRNIKGGELRQEDSKLLLGIQAADIAARIAATEYERFPFDRRAGAQSLKQRFAGVLLNDTWL